MCFFSLHCCSFNPLLLTALSARAVSIQLGLITPRVSDSPVDSQAVITPRRSHCNGILQCIQPLCALMWRRSMFIGRQALKMLFRVSPGLIAVIGVNGCVTKHFYRTTKPTTNTPLLYFCLVQTDRFSEARIHRQHINSEFTSEFLGVKFLVFRVGLRDFLSSSFSFIKSPG